MSILLRVNLISFFKFGSISSIINLSGTISMAILCSCYMLNFWFYTQFDQLDEEKQSIIVICIIQILFYHQVPFHRNECNFLNHYKKIKQEMIICLYSIQRLYVTHDVQHNTCFLFYKHNVYKHTQPQFCQKNKHILSIFTSLRSFC